MAANLSAFPVHRHKPPMPTIADGARFSHLSFGPGHFSSSRFGMDFLKGAVGLNEAEAQKSWRG